MSAIANQTQTARKSLVLLPRIIVLLYMYTVSSYAIHVYVVCELLLPRGFHRRGLKSELLFWLGYDHLSLSLSLSLSLTLSLTHTHIILLFIADILYHVDCIYTILGVMYMCTVHVLINVPRKIIMSAGWHAIRAWKLPFANRWRAKFVHKSIGARGWAHLNRAWKLHFRLRWCSY